MEAKRPKGIKASGNRLHMLIKRPGRGWDWETTGLGLDQVDAAVQLRKTTQAIIDTGTEAEAYGRLTVRAYAQRWLRDRKERGIKSVSDDETRLGRHVLSYELATGKAFGALYLDEVRPMHCRAVIRAAIEKGLAPRTVLNVHTTAKSLFGEAVPDELIQVTPWAVPRKDLPRKRDKDPKWRATAKFTLAEMRTLLWAADDVVPWDRRMFYALLYFGAMRFGEGASRRWRDRLEVEPRRALHIHDQYSTERKAQDETKTENVRMMPEHPTLSALLGAWRLSGWREFFGRAPGDDDLIVPSRRGANRSSNHMLKKFHEDLERLKVRPRRLHDLRRSFIGHAIDAGATRERLKPGTHGVGSSVLELYDSPEWSACCDAVLKLRFDEPQLITMPMAMAVGTSETVGRLLEGESKMHQTAGFEQDKWRGGRDLNPLHRARSVPVSASDSGNLGPGPTARSWPEAGLEAASLPILPADVLARSLLDSCGGDIEVAIVALRKAKGGPR